MTQLFDVSLLATIGLIFLVSLVGGYLRGSRRDPCLRSFDGYHVTLERADGKHVWGVMELEATGLELCYRNAVQDEEHIEASYIMYADEYEDIRAIFRYVDDLTEENKRKREADLQRAFYPSLLRMLGRRSRHFTATASESLAEVFGLLVGRLRKPAGRYITDSSEAHLRDLGANVIGRVGTSHDPLLERYIGEKVVVEVLESGDEVHEHVGIFKNYSADFIEILDVQFPQRHLLDLAAERERESVFLTAKVEGKTLKVTNNTTQPILIQSIGAGEQEEMINVVAAARETIELYPQNLNEAVQLNTRVVRELDMIVPRTRCLVRHRASSYKQELIPEIVFDLGIVLRGNSLAEARETRLRRQLQANPKSALAAVNLGAVLMQRGEYDEAERWLQQAICAKADLPDNGRRARMLLSEMQRRRAKSPIYLGGRPQLGANLSTAVRSVDEMTAALATHTPRMYF
ncbi:MAG: hypothetical protein R2911_27750 [Caldilineaceae bacterium]